MTRSTSAVLLLLGLITSGCAGRVVAPGPAAHPIERFPLTVLVGRLDDDVERAIQRAIDDWNTVFRETLRTAVPAFRVRPATQRTDVAIEPAYPFYAPATARSVQGRAAFAGPAVETSLYAWSSGAIRLPVRIDIRQAAIFDESSRETFFYRAVVRELGRVLGLSKVEDPKSARGWLIEHYARLEGRQPF